MQIFAVVGILDDQRALVIQLAKGHYGKENVYVVPNGAFIASDGETTKEVSLNIGIGDDEHNYNGVVVMMQYYWGYHDKELWEWITAKSRSVGVQQSGVGFFGR